MVGGVRYDWIGRGMVRRSRKGRVRHDRTGHGGCGKVGQGKFRRSW